MKKLGFVRVGSVVNKLFLADPINNAKEIVKMIKKAVSEDIAVVATPQLSLTGYSCGDLFFQEKLLKAAVEGLQYIIDKTAKFDIISIVGMPLRIKNGLYNVAVVVRKGEILGVIPKKTISNKKGEERWFSSSINLDVSEIELLGQAVSVLPSIIFRDSFYNEMSFAIEFAEDLDNIEPLSCVHVMNGANIIFNLASSNEIVGRDEYRHELVKVHSKKTISGYVYVSSGIMESSSDFVFSGSSMIYEDGHKLAVNNKFDFESNLIYADIDVERLANLRMRNSNYFSYDDSLYQFIDVDFHDTVDFSREYKEYPFVPKDDSKRVSRCQEIFTIQAAGLARRLVHLNYPKCVLGISGGLDSTLAFLVVVEAYKMLGLDNKNIIGVTMPGFGTTGRTYNNACDFV